MNTSTLIKIMAGLMPLSPVTSDVVDETFMTEESEESAEEETDEDYDGPTMEEAVAAHDSSVPTIEGAENINVQVGDTFDPLAGVYAIDNQDGDITDSIEVSNDNVDTSSPGNYNVTYEVENSRNGWFEYTRQVTVSEEPSDSIPSVPPTEEDSTEDESEDSSDNEVLGSEVVFNGIEDTTISQGSDFDALEDVSILDTDGLDITSEVYLSGEVDTSTPGEYTIAYALFDLFDQPHAEARTITVE